MQSCPNANTRCLKGNLFEWPFSFDIQHQYPTYQQSSLKIHNTFSAPNSYFGTKCCHSNLWIFKPIFFKMIFGNLKFNFTYLDPFFMVDIKTLVVISSVCLPFFWSFPSFDMCEIGRLLGICDFPPTLFCETAESEALWGLLYFGTLNLICYRIEHTYWHIYSRLTANHPKGF